MTKYCDVHGAVEVPDGIFACIQDLGGWLCGTKLKASADDLEGNRRAAAQPAATNADIEFGPAPARSKTRIIADINVLLAELAESQ